MLANVILMGSGFSFRNLSSKITIQEPTFDRIIVVYRYVFDILLWNNYFMFVAVFCFSLTPSPPYCVVESGATCGL